MSLRFLYPGDVSPEYGAAADAVLFKEVSEERSPPTLFIYSRNKPTISLGRFRDFDKDANLRFVKENNISVVRRVSGGSSIFTSSSQIICSLVIKDSFENIQESYFEICKCIMSALDSLDINSLFKEPNDIIVNGRKISGSAQYRAKGFLLHHGSLIIEPEPLMDKVLKPVKNRSYDGVISVSESLNRKVTKEEVVLALRNAFEENLKMRIYDGLFTKKETEDILSRQEEFKVSVSDLSNPSKRLPEDP